MASIELAYYGHSCFEISTNEVSLLFDPFITPNPQARYIDVNSLSPNYILISHGHQDHVADVGHIYQNSRATIISNYEIVNWFFGQGIDQADGIQMNHGGKLTLPFGTVKYVNAVHSSNMPDGAYGGNPGGFVVEVGGKTIYFAGDTALTWDMKLIPMSYQLDLAILPIGDHFTMGVDDAVIASQFIECDKIVGCHYDTFPPIALNRDEAINKFAAASKELIFLEVGERFSV